LRRGAFLPQVGERAMQSLENAAFPLNSPVCLDVGGFVGPSGKTLPRFSSRRFDPCHLHDTATAAANFAIHGLLRLPETRRSIIGAKPR